MLFKREVKAHLKSEFVRNSATLVSGNVIGQGFALLSYLILARFFYSAEDFGVFSIFLSITSLFAILSTGMYEEAFLVVKDEKQELSLLSLVCRILLGFSCVLFLLLLFFKDTLLVLFKAETVADYWYLIPLMVFFTGLFSILARLANRERRYKNIAVANVALNVESSVLKLLFGFFSFGGIGLILANTIAQAAASLSYHKLKDKFQKAFYYRKELSEVHTATTYKAFPLYTMPRSFINTFSTNLPFFVLAAAFGEAKLGLFSMALALGTRPLNLVSGSIYQVLFEKIASLRLENKSISAVLKQFCVKMLAISLPLAVVAFFAAKPLFGIVLGSKWIESASYFQYLLPWMLVNLVRTSMGFIPIVLKRQHLALGVEIFFLVARFLVLYFAILKNNFDLGILLFSMVSFLFVSVTLMWYFVLIKRYENSLLK